MEILDTCTTPSRTRCFQAHWSASILPNTMTSVRPALTSISNPLVITGTRLSIRKLNLPSPSLRPLQQSARFFSAQRVSLKTSPHRIRSSFPRTYLVETSLRHFSFSQLLFPFELLRLFSPKSIAVTV